VEVRARRRRKKDTDAAQAAVRPDIVGGGWEGKRPKRTEAKRETVQRKSPQPDPERRDPAW